MTNNFCYSSRAPNLIIHSWAKPCRLLDINFPFPVFISSSSCDRIGIFNKPISSPYHNSLLLFTKVQSSSIDDGFANLCTRYMRYQDIFEDSHSHNFNPPPPPPPPPPPLSLSLSLSPLSLSL